MTNTEKFKEVFGYTPEVCCLISPSVCREQDDCENCPFDDWWQQEYRECFEFKEEYE